jgi:response regulator RpfG family c-di-GMP phosphodiesterase
MKTHPVIGAEIVAPIQKLSDVAPIIRAHQEKYDGTGYPSGLKEEEIPLAARVLTTIDAYGAMIEDRIYRPARSKEEAREELEACAGADFDPHVVEAFIRVLKEIGEV